MPQIFSMRNGNDHLGYNNRVHLSSILPSHPCHQECGEKEKDLGDILCGRRPRQVGEPPARMGNFVRLCPGTAAHRYARRLRRRVIRPQPGDDDDPHAKP